MNSKHVANGRKGARPKGASVEEGGSQSLRLGLMRSLEPSSLSSFRHASAMLSEQMSSIPVMHHDLLEKRGMIF